MLQRLSRSVFYCFILAVVGYLTACNMEKDIDIELPYHEPQLVAECYLEINQPYRLTLIESSGYLDKPEANIVKEATVVIFYRGRPDTLRYGPYYDYTTRKFYTHHSETRMRARAGEIMSLEIKDKKGRKLTGTTTILASVPIDSVTYSFNEKEKALVVARFKDPGATEDFYLFSVHNDSTTHDPEVSYSSPDRLNNGEPFAFGTGFRFKKNQKIIVSLYRLEKQYFNFLSSVDDAKDSNGNPFAQPSGVKSSVQGGYGIFTNLAKEERIMVLK